MEDADIRQLKEYILEPFKDIIRVEFATFKAELERVRAEHEKHQEENDGDVQRFSKSIERIHIRTDGVERRQDELEAKIDAKPTPVPFLQIMRQKAAEYLVAFIYILFLLQFLPGGMVSQGMAVLLKANGM